MLLLMAFGMSGTSVGCNPRSSDQPWYYWGLYNTTEEQISEIKVHSPNRWNPEAETLRAGVNRHMGPGFRPIPAKAFITWKTSDGKPHRQELLIGNAMTGPKHFAGTIWFVYTNKGWEIRTITETESWRRASTGRYDYPNLPQTKPDRPPDKPIGRYLRTIGARDRPAMSAKEYAPFFWAYYNASLLQIGPIRVDIIAERPLEFLSWVVPVKSGQAIAGPWNGPNSVSLQEIKQVIVSWQYEGAGQTHHQKILMAGRIKNPMDFQGIIWFEFTDDGVKMIPMKQQRIEELEKQGRPLQPD